MCPVRPCVTTKAIFFIRNGVPREQRDDGTIAEEKTFTYLIREDLPAGTDDKGINSRTRTLYDITAKRVTVTMKLVDDKLTADVGCGKEGKFSFTNRHEPPETPPPPHVPKTGEPANVPLYLAMMLAAAPGLWAVCAARPRRKKKSRR